LQVRVDERPQLVASHRQNLQKKARTSSTSRSGASIAAKWPPRDISDQCTTVCSRSTIRRMAGSLGKTATPVGTVDRGRSVTAATLSS
jgi:hypothetical protein